YPNPFNPETTISYLIPKVTNVELSIYNSLGQRIRTFNINRQPAGEHQIKWDGKDETGRQVASGIYLYHLKAGDNITAGKMIFMK
ncbi:MAG: T9SS type A sorting domain-containing protein, partial [Calditrichia bacterium]|nr:T9SS type A sorting domain-containing protein [Calditrichia bacterium]